MQEEEKLREITVTSGRKCSESYPFRDRLTFWQRTFMDSLLLTEEWSSPLSTLTWRQNSTKLVRQLYFRLLPSVPHIEGIGSGFVPTPDSTGGAPKKNSNKRNGPKSLIEYARMAPTPTARLGSPRGAQGKRYTDPKRSNDLDDYVAHLGDTGSLNPTWVEWLQGLPLGWTDLEG